MSALSDLQVLDLSTRLSGAFCARLFADFGADVLLAEPPDGHPLRREPPLLPNVPALEASLLHAYANANKRGLILDPDDPTALAELVSRADVIIADQPPVGVRYAAPGPRSPPASMPPTNGDRWATIAAAAERGTIVVAVTPYGLSGPLAGLPGNDLTAYALSGWAAGNGDPDRPPLKGSHNQDGYLAGSAAFVGALAALYHHDRTGEGQTVDVAELETLAITEGPSLLVATYAGAVPPRHAADIVRGPVPARDGYISLTISRAQFWRDAMTLLELPDLAADDRYSQGWFRRQERANYSGRVEARLREWNRWDLFDALALRRCVIGVVQDMRDVNENPHLAARGFFVETALPDGRRAQFPGAPFKMSATPWSLRRPAPVLDHRSQATGHREAAGSRQSARHTRQSSLTVHGPRSTVHSSPTPPLSGVRAIVLTQAWSGTFATELLGLLGAEVVQIEARGRPDSWRGDFSGAVPAAIADPTKRQRAWNTNGLYNAVNLNKRAITLDLSTPRGVDLFRRLVPLADLVAENFTPRVMANLGLDYASLCRLKPDIILASLSAYGATGPYAHVPGIGGTIEPMSGMSSLLGYPGGRPQNSGSMYPDPVAGYYCAAALLLALRHRERTGAGQHIDLGMMEANATFIGDALLQHAAGLGVRGPMGNRHLRIAPHGIYPARDGGWLALSADEGPAWRALTALLGRSDLADDPRFAAMAGRKAHEEELDAAIAAWSAAQDADEATAALRAAGVTAAPVHNSLAVAQDAQLQSRGFLVQVNHPEAGCHTQVGIPWQLSRTPAAVTHPAPGLGVTPDEYEELVALGIAGDAPP